MLLLLILSVVERSVPEKETDAVDCRKSHKCVDNSCKHCVLTAENPRNKVEFEQSYKSPVNAADDVEYQRNSAKYFQKNHSFCTIVYRGVIIYSLHFFKFLLQLFPFCRLFCIRRSSPEQTANHLFLLLCRQPHHSRQ